ncbi:hypothetical protein [Alkalihalobacillus sp. 1P02AB]|uniref:hypothetical protein n=1 Tax=Alkalihalobacillus sp. 1P02AB TaxID=3132260 RepID=UPI0039A5FC50
MENFNVRNIDCGYLTEKHCQTNHLLSNIPVVAGQQLLMVFSATVVGLDLILTVTGNANAGVEIS